MCSLVSTSKLISRNTRRLDTRLPAVGTLGNTAHWGLHEGCETSEGVV